MIGPESSLSAWLPRALERGDGTTVLVVDPRHSARPDRQLVEAVSELLETEPLRIDAAHGWARLAGLPGATLPTVDVPLAVASADDLVLLTAPRGPEGVARLWLGIVHPNTAMRARPLPNDGVVELAGWLPASWIIRLAAAPASLVAVTRSAVLAELLASGFARMSERSTGVEAITPWEEPAVQRLFDLQLPATDGGTMIHAVDTATARRSMLIELAETINATIETAEGCGE